MTPKEVRNEIVKRFLAQFTGQFAIAVTGHRFVPPQIPAPWVRISVIFNEGGQTSLGVKGNRRFQKSGFVNVQVFTPVNKGTDQNDVLSHIVILIWLRTSWPFSMERVWAMGCGCTMAA